MKKLKNKDKEDILRTNKETENREDEKTYKQMKKLQKDCEGLKANASKQQYKEVDINLPEERQYRVWV